MRHEYRLLFGLLVVTVLGTHALSGPNIPAKEFEPEYWHKLASDSLQEALKVKDNTNKAKNIILFIGDGMGGTTITGARILRGQTQGQPGEEAVLEFEKFPNVALSKTYNVDRQTADSAGTATAMFSGVKTNFLVVGLNPKSTVKDCESAHGNEVDTVLDWARTAGKRTGVVVTSRITHATPASLYAKSAYRYWEGDVDTVDVTGGCKDIAQQLVERHNDLNVILGGGRRYFMPNDTADPEYNTINKNQRQDGRDLIEEWKQKKMEHSQSYEYVWNKGQFENVDTNTDYLLGLFEPNHMQYDLERNADSSGEPSLAEMTSKAIDMLDKDDNGYFLMVEGSRIDHGHHDNLAKKALYETLTFDDAVKVAVEKTNPEDTLILVTADHSSAFDITGYAYRGSDVFGLVEPVDPTEETKDGKPYSVLYYANGPGNHYPEQSREDLSNANMHDNNYAYPAGVPMPWATHGGEDVFIYAKGPMSHLVRGVQEQNYIAHVMAYSACIGPYSDNCPRSDSSCHGSTNGSDVKTSHNAMLIFSLALAVIVTMLL